MTEHVKLYDVEGREYVAAEEDVERRLQEGFLRERPDPESDPDRVVEVATVLNRPQVVQPFDPGEHTVDEVLDYLGGQDDDHPAVTPDEHDRVVEAERAGKNRKGITGD